MTACVHGNTKGTTANLCQSQVGHKGTWEDQGSADDNFPIPLRGALPGLASGMHPDFSQADLLDPYPEALHAKVLKYI